MSSIIIRILKQIRNDHRSMALLIVAPLFIMTILYFLLGTTDYVPKLATFQLPAPLQTSLSEDLNLTSLKELPADPYTYLDDHSLDGILSVDSSGMHLYLKEQDNKSAKLMKTLQTSLQSMGGSSLDIQYQYETNQDNQLDSLGYVFVGVLSFFFVFILSGVSFVGERSSQTLDRMLLSPLNTASIIGGYTIGYGLLSAIQGSLIILFAAYALKLHFQGSVLLCIMIMVLLSFAAVSTGTLLSIFAANQFQMIQFIPVIIVPQIFFSGLIPLDTIPFHLGSLSYLFPVYYGCTALRQVMIYGEGFTFIIPWLCGLLAYIGILFLLNVIMLKRHN